MTAAWAMCCGGRGKIGDPLFSMAGLGEQRLTMAVGRPNTLGATRVCPHCKATVLQSAAICPGCHHHLRFNAAGSEPQIEGHKAMKLEVLIHHPGRGECEYCVVVSITNEQGEKIARHVVGVGALASGERHKFTFSVDVVPARPPGKR